MKFTFVIFLGLLLVVGIYLGGRRNLRGAMGLHILETPNWVITAEASEAGIIYSVVSKTGQVMPVGLTDAELKSRFPDLYEGLRAPLSRYRRVIASESASKASLVP